MLKTFVVRTRSQLRYIVCGSIAFNSTNFTKVIDCMTAVACTSANSQKENAAFILANFRQSSRNRFNSIAINLFETSMTSSINVRLKLLIPFSEFCHVHSMNVSRQSL